MYVADLLIVTGLEEERSKTGSNQQLKSPPSMREYVLRSGKEVKKTFKKTYVVCIWGIYIREHYLCVVQFP